VLRCASKPGEDLLAGLGISCEMLVVECFPVSGREGRLGNGIACPAYGYTVPWWISICVLVCLLSVSWAAACCCRQEAPTLNRVEIW